MYIIFAVTQYHATSTHTVASIHTHTYTIQNGHWTKWHWLLTVCSPTPMAMLLLIATKGWSGFTIRVGRMPLPAILVIIGTKEQTNTQNENILIIHSLLFHQV